MMPFAIVMPHIYLSCYLFDGGDNLAQIKSCLVTCRLCNAWYCVVRIGIVKLQIHTNFYVLVIFFVVYFRYTSTSIKIHIRMKFRARMLDVAAIRKFHEILNTMAKLSKVCVLRLTSQKLYFIITDLNSSCGANSAVGGPCVWCDIDHSYFFQDYNLEGVTKEENEIYLELEPEKLAKNLSVLKSSSTTAR